MEELNRFLGFYLEKYYTCLTASPPLCVRALQGGDGLLTQAPLLGTVPLPAPKRGRVSMCPDSFTSLDPPRRVHRLKHPFVANGTASPTHTCKSPSTARRVLRAQKRVLSIRRTSFFLGSVFFPILALWPGSLLHAGRLLLRMMRTPGCRTVAVSFFSSTTKNPQNRREQHLLVQGRAAATTAASGR